MTEYDVAIITQIWGDIDNSDDYDDFKRHVQEFTTLAKEGLIHELFSSMIISTAIIAKQNEFENRELRAGLESITAIFEPDKKMIDNKDDLKTEDNFKDDNVVDL
ncbi:hypothetical protein, partial [Nocardia mangyaensis]|uniref:hypothetical protein n=1 Tax=Nocardia mangyaensis TaxID=2213200 RepID=UPI0026770075